MKRNLLYEKFIQIHLIIKDTGIFREKRINQLASPIEILPTLLNFFGIKKMDSYPEMDHLALKKRKIIFCQNEKSSYALRTKKFKLLNGSKGIKLCNLEKAPFEKENIFHKAIKKIKNLFCSRNMLKANLNKEFGLYKIICWKIYWKNF